MSNFDENLARIKTSIENSKFKLTGKLMFRFYEKIKNIKNSIDKLDPNDEHYSGKILLRSLIEHLIVSYYVWYNFILTKSDECAREYYEEYFVGEFFKQEGYKQKLNKIKIQNYKNLNGLDFIKSLHSKLDELSDSQYQNINSVRNKFSFVNLFEYLINSEPLGQNRKNLHEYMLGFLDEYNTLSSYVHGGPYAEKEFFDTDIIEDNNTPKNWAASSLHMIQQNILFFLCEEDSKYLELID